MSSLTEYGIIPHNEQYKSVQPAPSSAHTRSEATMSKHTPGPWTIDWNVSRLDIFSADAATLVATLRRSALSPGIDDAAKANARLIAAAPELLEALQAVQAFITGEPNAVEPFGMVRAAIAKAGGNDD